MNANVHPIQNHSLFQGDPSLNPSLLSTKAMLIKLTLRKFSVTKRDKGATEETARKYNTNEDMCAVVKRLLPARVTKPIADVDKAMRDLVNGRSLPWSDTGYRITGAENVMDLSGEIQQLRGKRETLVEDLISNLDGYKQQVQRESPDLYKEEDYPSDDVVRAKFDVTFDICPIPDLDDMRVGLAEDEVDRIRQEANRHFEQAMQGATYDALSRLYDVVHRMAETMTERTTEEMAELKERAEDPERKRNIDVTPHKTFKDTMVGNMRDLVDVLPSLNVMSDRTLTELIDKVKSSLTIYDPSDIRDDLQVRSILRQRSQALETELLDRMDAYSL